MIASRPPSRHDLEYAPVLAVLHALDAMLAATAIALHRAHPSLRERALDFDDSRDLRLHLAAVLMAISAALRRQLAEYRQVAEQERRDADEALDALDDLPF